MPQQGSDSLRSYGHLVRCGSGGWGETLGRVTLPRRVHIYLVLSCYPKSDVVCKFEYLVPLSISYPPVGMNHDNTFPDQMNGPAVCSRNVKVDSRLRHSFEQDGHRQVDCPGHFHYQTMATSLLGCSLVRCVALLPRRKRNIPTYQFPSTGPRNLGQTRTYPRSVQVHQDPCRTSIRLP